MVVQSLTAKFFTVAQNVWRLERFWNLDDVLSLLNSCHWMWSDCSDASRSTWHVLAISSSSSSSSSSRHSQPRLHVVMTWHRVEIAWQRVIHSMMAIRLARKLRCCHVTVTSGNVSRLVIDEVEPTIVWWNLTTVWHHTRHYSNSIMTLQSTFTATDGCWLLTSIGLICTMFIMMTTHVIATCRIHALRWNAAVWEPMRLLPMHRKCWVSLHSVLRTSSVYWVGNIATSLCLITTTYTQKLLPYVILLL